VSYIAEMETRNYSWMATGDTEKLAIKAMLSGWRKWKRSNNAAGFYCDWMTDDEVRDEIRTIKLLTFNSATGKHVKPACWHDHTLYWAHGMTDAQIHEFNRSK